MVIKQADSLKQKVGYLYQFGKTEMVMKCVTKAMLYKMVFASSRVIQIVQVIAKYEVPSAQSNVISVTRVQQLFP